MAYFDFSKLNLPQANLLKASDS